VEKYRTLKMVHGTPVLRRGDLTGDEILRLRSLAIYSPTCVFLFPSGTLEQLASTCDGAIYNRGHKLAAKPLTYYFAHRTGLVRLRAGYHHPGQAERGVCALIESKSILSKGSVFFIGLSEALFEQLWNRALQSELPESGKDSLDAAPEIDQLGLLLNQNTQLEVPRALVDRYVGDSAAADGVRKRIVLASRVLYPVLIEGETGTGKEVVARMIHQLSSREADSFEAVNCGAIPAELFESTLFGHVKGAFTGALRDKTGHWTQANNGTLFLDEIGDLPLLNQVKVLRALEDGQYYPVGGTAAVTSEARIIAATNRNLRQMIAVGKFREDLFYRLFSLRIRTPSLREQPSVIPLLVAHFWQHLEGKKLSPLPREVIDDLKRYPWPGNARELRSFLTSLFVLADGQPVTSALVRAVMRDRIGPAVASEKDP